MIIENRILTLDAQINNEQINDLISEILINIDSIDKIVIQNLENGITTSALFSLLYAVKIRKNEIQIPFYDDYESIPNMGKTLFVSKD